MANLLFTLETELHSFMEVLLKSIVDEFSEVFRNRMVKITQCVEESFGSEVAQLKKENESLKWRLQLWETESGAGGDRGQTDHVGYTLPCEATAGIKEEMDTKLELSGSEASALPDAGERAPLEQQHSEEEWGSSLMQETELSAAEGKETLSEQHTESSTLRAQVMWTRAVWIEQEGEVEGVLPSNWVDARREYVWWPNDPKQATKLYKEKANPNKDTWVTFKVIKVKHTSDKKSECDHFDLTTSVMDAEDEDETPNPKRKSKKRVFSDYVDDFDSDAATPEKKKPLKLPVPPPKLRFSPRKSVSQSSLSCSSMLKAQVVQIVTSPRKVQSPKQVIRPKSSTEPQSHHASSASHSPSPSPSSRSESPRQKTTSRPEEKRKRDPLSEGKFQKRVLGLLIEMMDELRRLGRSTEPVDSQFHIRRLTTMEEFCAYEQALDSMDNQNLLINQLRRVGGSDVRECVFTVLSRLMTNELMSEFNFAGTNRKDKQQKRGLGDTNLYRVIKAAVLKSHPTSTEKEIKEHAMRYLKNAYARQGARRSGH
ncbi:uncharacterized protein [Lepisosteus oculatus]|uniref:uncharacterized protein isoform X1 n=1 Tax=Lepisosteus oculatus TaxID=7918 RepID=UPI0035F50BB8